MDNLLRELNHTFKGYEKQVFLVGGCIRDYLLGETPKDIDLLTTIPKEVLFEMGARYVDPATSYPVFYLNHERLGKIELAHPRTEVKTGNKHTDFKVDAGSHITVEQDLKRRDFTINSIAMDLEGKVINPFCGVEDVRFKLLIHTSEAFGEDALRVYRALRFSCKGFDIVQETQELISSMDVTNVPGERVFNEMLKAMGEKHPTRFFENLVKCNIGEHLFGDVLKMKDVVAGPEEHHDNETVLDHCLDVLDQVSKNTENPFIRLAAFFHDIGKVATPVEELPHHYDHDNRGVELVATLLENLKAPTVLKDMCKAVTGQHMKYTKAVEMRPSKILKFAKQFEHSLDALFHVSNADHSVERTVEVKKVFDVAVEVNKMSVFELGLDPENFKGRPGDVISHMILDRRVGEFKRRMHS